MKTHIVRTENLTLHFTEVYSYKHVAPHGYSISGQAENISDSAVKPLLNMYVDT